jgi:hypothetical protein
MKKIIPRSLILLAVGIFLFFSAECTVGSPITIEMIKSNDAVSVKKAIAEGADVNAIMRDSYDATNYSLLMLAAKYNAFSVAELLINNGANINQDIEGLSPLFWAIKAKSFEIVELLLDHGLAVNPIKERGNSPLETAAIFGDVKIVKLLIERGANVRGENLLPLSNAVVYSEFEIAKVLVENGADLNEYGLDGKTPLMIAAEMEAPDMVQFLLEKGADVSRKDDSGETVAQLAPGDNKKIIDLLRQHGVKVGFFKYEQSRLGYPFNEMPILLLITVFFILFVTWTLLVPKLTRKIDVFIIKFVIRIFGVMLILFASFAVFLCCLAGGSSSTQPLELYILTYSSVGLFITGFGILTLRKWFWYFAIILLAIFIIAYIRLSGFNKVLSDPTDLANFIISIIFCLFLLLPKVKEQFR